MVEEAPSPTSQSEAHARGARRGPRWHLVYSLLAGFDLLTVSLGLYLNHRLVTTYLESVAENQEWAGHLGEVAQLDELASAVNAPGNDVFDPPHNVACERARLLAAREEFRLRI